MNRAAITTPHAIGFRPASARPENVTIPAIDPRMSSREPSESGSDPVGDGGHGERGRDEDEGQHQPDRQPARLDTEVHQVTARAVDRRWESDHQAQEESQNDRGETEQIRLLVGAEEPDPDAEEAAQQDEVGEVGEVHDVRARPADQDQLDEEHEERR